MVGTHTGLVASCLSSSVSKLSFSVSFSFFDSAASLLAIERSSSGDVCQSVRSHTGGPYVLTGVELVVALGLALRVSLALLHLLLLLSRVVLLVTIYCIISHCRNLLFVRRGSVIPSYIPELPTLDEDIVTVVFEKTGY